MKTDVEMTDAEVAAQIERADRFIADFREMIAATVVDPASACADYQRRGLQRIADTVDAVPYRDDVQPVEPRCGVARRDHVDDRCATDGGRCWSNIGLRRRGVVPCCIRTDG